MLDGSVGNGGTELKALLVPFVNKDPNPLVTLRDGDAMVA